MRPCRSSERMQGQQCPRNRSCALARLSHHSSTWRAVQDWPGGKQRIYMPALQHSVRRAPSRARGGGGGGQLLRLYKLLYEVRRTGMKGRRECCSSRQRQRRSGFDDASNVSFFRLYLASCEIRMARHVSILCPASACLGGISTVRKDTSQRQQ